MRRMPLPKATCRQTIDAVTRLRLHGRCMAPSQRARRAKRFQARWLCPPRHHHDEIALIRAGGLSVQQWLRLTLLCLGLAAASGCSRTECAEGEIESAGHCVVTCRDEHCPGDSRCINYTCRPPCMDDTACRGEDRCEQVETDFGTRGRYCYGLPLRESPYTSDASSSNDSNAADCRRSSDCPSTPTHACVDGRCRITCLLHEHCGERGACAVTARSAEGHDVGLCASDDFPRGSGRYESRCPRGSGDCDRAAGFRCVGAGEGDIESYCTQTGCEADDDCPSGYYCNESLLFSLLPCQPECGLPAAPSGVDCVPLEEIGDGRPFACVEEGGLQQRLCLRRSFCNPCETDADCRALPHQLCAKGPDGTKQCTVLCDPDSNGCPWGSATSCSIYDETLGLPTCGHRFGSCQGSGSGCEPCIEDADCPLGFCSGSEYTGERFCVDESITCSCPPGDPYCAGGGCPTTPGGLSANCVPRTPNESPSVCFGGTLDPRDPASQVACWASTNGGI